MTNLVFVVSHAALVCVEPAGGGEGDFLKPCLQTDPADCFPFTASSLEVKKKRACPGHLHVEREMPFPREMTEAVAEGRNLV